MFITVRISEVFYFSQRGIKTKETKSMKQSPGLYFAARLLVLPRVVWCSCSSPPPCCRSQLVQLKLCSSQWQWKKGVTKFFLIIFPFPMMFKYETTLKQKHLSCTCLSHHRGSCLFLHTSRSCILFNVTLTSSLDSFWFSFNCSVFRKKGREEILTMSSFQFLMCYMQVGSPVSVALTLWREHHPSPSLMPEFALPVFFHPLRQQKCNGEHAYNILNIILSI